ncbi:MAG: hypothetical protein AAFQ82_05865 [Myxococcota bacterium]
MSETNAEAIELLTGWLEEDEDEENAGLRAENALLRDEVVWLRSMVERLARTSALHTTDTKED